MLLSPSGIRLTREIVLDVSPNRSDDCDNRDSFQNILILIGFLGAINHNNIDGQSPIR
jgi:hypothetical protein